MCTGCKFIGYCSSSCQSFGWAKHKIECRHLKNIKHPNLFPDEARLIARICWRLTSGGNTDKGYYTKTEYRQFGDLMSRKSRDQLRNTDKEKNCVTIYFNFIL